ncbi:MAG TPA: hypothetical protein VFT80_09000 [Actinomycetota bacterium]|nr:hypothetical protein [Actinomycetota bacterium]
MTGPAGVTALVLAETVAGSLWLLFLTPLWGEVRRGFFKLTGAVLLVLSGSMWYSISVGLVEGDDAGRWSLWLAGVLTAMILAWVVLMFTAWQPAGRILGIASVPVSVALLIAMAGTAEGSGVVAAIQLLAGAAFLGAVLAGLLLGHWYLTDRGLTRTPINRFTTVLLVAVGLEIAALLLGGFGATADDSQFNPLLTSAGLAAWIALGMAGTTLLIAVLIRAALKGQRSSAVQAATGFFYLAVITAMTAEFAAKVRFLP